MIPRKLTSFQKEKLCQHLKSLQGQDRRLRFGTVVNDEYIEKYVNESFNTNSKWFGVEVDGRIRAACHASIFNGEAELGCSVDEEYRGNKIAQAMFERAVTWLRTKGIKKVFMHCLTENAPMRHIAKKNDMVVVSEQGETDASVEIDPPTFLTPLVDAYSDRMAFYDMIWKNNMSMFLIKKGENHNQ